MKKSLASNMRWRHAQASLAALSKYHVRDGERFIVIGRLHFLVKSKSEEGWHCVDLETVNEDWPEGGCSCRGYQVRRTCRHVDAIFSWLESRVDAP